MSNEPEAPECISYGAPAIGTVEDHFDGTTSQDLVSKRIAYASTHSLSVVLVKIAQWRSLGVAILHGLPASLHAAFITFEEIALTIATDVRHSGNTIRRDSPFVAQIADALNLTSTLPDAYFIAAAAIPA